MGSNPSKKVFRDKYDTYLMKQDEEKKNQFTESTISYFTNNQLPIEIKSLQNLDVYILTKTAKDVPKGTPEIWRDKENKKDEDDNESDEEEGDHFVVYVLEGKIKIDENTNYESINKSGLNIVLSGDYEKYTDWYCPQSLCIKEKLKDFFENNEKDDEGFYVKKE